MCIIACHSPCIVDALTDHHTKAARSMDLKSPLYHHKLGHRPEFSLKVTPIYANLGPS